MQLDFVHMLWSADLCYVADFPLLDSVKLV